MRIARKNLFIFGPGILILAFLSGVAALVWRAGLNTPHSVGAQAVVPLPASTSEGPSRIPIELTAVPAPTIRPAQQVATDFGRIDPDGLRAWRKVMATTRLSPLENRKLDPDDIEIRIWQLPGLYILKTKCWVFSREAGLWTGYALVDVDFKGPIVKIPLDTHSSGWRNWEFYTINDLSPARLTEPRPKSDQGNEGMATIIEVKFGKDYARRYADDDLLYGLFGTIKSEILNNDQERWSKF
jgi:hypothetical protein